MILSHIIISVVTRVGFGSKKLEPIFLSARAEILARAMARSARLDFKLDLFL